MLPRRPTTKVLTGKQNTGALEAWLIQNKLGPQRPLVAVHAWLTLVLVTPGIKQVGAKPCPFNGLQELFRNDGIGINIGPIKGGDQPLVNGQRRHAMLLTSTKCPATPAAAAIAGETK